MENRDNTGLGAGSAVKLDTSFGHEGGGDFSLPDYLPEIQRLLAVRTSVLPETAFLSGNVLEIGGTLSYDVIYADAEGKAVSASLITDYNADTALSQAVDNVGELFVSTEEESTLCRVTSPRGVNIKTRMKTRVCADERVVTDGALTRKDGTRAHDGDLSSVERLNSSAISVFRGRAATTGNAAGEIESHEKNDTVAFCRSSLCVTDATCDDGTVKTSGEIMLDCTFCGSDGLYTKSARYPFEVSVNSDGCDSGCVARAWGRVASVGISKEDADSTVFSVSVEYDVEAEYLCKCECNVCFDVYSTKYECTGDIGECDLITPVSFGMAKVPLSGSAEMHAENALKIVGIIPISKTAQAVMSPDGLIISGNVKVKAVAVGDGTMCAEIDLPFKYRLGDADATDLQSFVTCCPLSLSGKVSGNTVEVSGEASLSWDVSCRKKLRYVTSVSLGDELDRSCPLSIKAYYPQSDESLWSICKKYTADIRKIKDANPDIGDVVAKGVPVIIY